MLKSQQSSSVVPSSIPNVNGPNASGNNFPRSFLTIALPMIFLLGFVLYSTIWNESSLLNLGLSSSHFSLPESLGTSVRCMPSSEVQALMNVVKKEQMRIWREWDVGNYPLFLNTMHIPKMSWAIQKYKFVKFFLEGRGGDTVRGGSSSDSIRNAFIVGFGGSSVTAGHGTLHCVLYSMILSCLGSRRSVDEYRGSATRTIH
jgi:hypothetical protein